jgi:flavin-dependent dehydrogenase
MTPIGEHAVVIGASMGGLLAARALSDFFTRVTLVERDALPATDTSRKGVPQGRHTHGLLARGRVVLEAFFPGLTDQIVASGGLRGDIANDVKWIGHNVTLAQAPSDMIGLLASRPMIEGHVRRRLLALPAVTVIDQCAVQGLVHHAALRRVTGIRVRVDDKPDETIAADLVVDASGRGSSSPAWLEGLRYGRPASEKIDIGIGYKTRLYRRHPSELGGKLGVVIAGSAPTWRNGVILAQENDTWTVSVGGFLGDDAPDDEERFLAYVASMPTKEIHDLVARAEPLSNLITYRYASSLRWRYERLADVPEGYLVFGDAIAASTRSTARV